MTSKWPDPQAKTTATVQLEDAYSIDIVGEHLVVYSECCCERILTVDKAHAVVDLIDTWIAQQA